MRCDDKLSNREESEKKRVACVLSADYAEIVDEYIVDILIVDIVH